LFTFVDGSMKILYQIEIIMINVMIRGSEKVVIHNNRGEKCKNKQN